MTARAGMLTRFFEHSMDLGLEWRVEDVWFELPESGDEELRNRVGRTHGAAVELPRRAARCGVFSQLEERDGDRSAISR